MTVTREDLTTVLADTLGLPQTAYRELMDSFFATIKSALASGKNINSLASGILTCGTSIPGRDGIPKQAYLVKSPPGAS